MLTTRGRRYTVEFDPSLAEAIESAAQARSTPYRRVTISDIVREAVVRFLLPLEGTNGSHLPPQSTIPPKTAGSL